VSQALFDTFRSQINAEYGLADPDDPARAQDVSLPNYLARLRKGEERQGKKAKKENIRELITESVRREVEAGGIKDRQGVEKYLKDQGYTITHAGEDYLTVEIDASLPVQLGRIRLKGGLYRKADWNPLDMPASRIRYGVADPTRAAELALRLAPMVEARAVFHRQRYGEPEPDHTPRRERTAGRGPEPLREYVARYLGADALREIWEPRRQRVRTANRDQQPTSGRRGHDRPGAAITRRLAAIGEAVRDANNRLGAALGRLDAAGKRLERGRGAVAASAAAIDPEQLERWWERYYGRDHGMER
jgi:hypothetical protein